MIDKANLYCYICEGETEQSLVKAIKGSKIKSGKFYKNNPWEKSISSICSKINYNSNVTLVIDIDKLNQYNDKHIKRLKENISLLEKNSKNLNVIIQNENLEDEIVLSTNINRINEMYHCTGVSEHKNLFNKDKNLSNKLESINFNINLFWCSNLDSLNIKRENFEFKI